MEKLIDLQMNEKQIDLTAQRCREKNIIVPTFKQMKNPELIPDKIKNELKNIGLWDVNPRNLFRITWKNEPIAKGGGFGGANYMEIPSSITGTKARIIALVGKWFPTGAHKVGASFGCLAPRLITGQFEPTTDRAVWPSTGNYCRGGAYVSALLGCQSIAILPAEMSKERFDWLANVAGEVIATPGCESNVKEIFDKCWELRKTRTKISIFNQFEEFGNVLWHYEVTGSSMEEIFKKEAKEGQNLAGVVLTSGSSGTMGSAYRMKELHPKARAAVGEALQCPTLLNNGFGGHRIEGIGDKHVPWIHDLKNTDTVIAVDDERNMRLLRLFNEPVGREVLVNNGAPKEIVDQFDLLGISGVGNLIAAIKFAKYYELDENDIVFTVFTDSMELYSSRMKEMTEQYGEYTRYDAERDLQRLMDITTDNMADLTYYERKRIHNLKYFTWIEQQARELDELNHQWFKHDEYWGQIPTYTDQIDKLIEEFNDRVGLL